jgi:hypothetical protein
MKQKTNLHHYLSALNQIKEYKKFIMCVTDTFSKFVELIVAR